MNDRSHTHVVSVTGVRRRIKNAIKILNEDKIGLYAAESAFYIVLSVFPFLLLLLTIARAVVPDVTIDYLYSFASHLPGEIGEFLAEEIGALGKRPTPAPFSLTVFGVLWSSSRGIRAVRRGVRSIYGGREESFFGEIIVGVILTASFVILIAAVLVFLVFGNTVAVMISDAFPPLYSLTEHLVSFSPIFFAVFLTLFFAFALRTFTPRSSGAERYRDHLPGAFLATFGWILYSYIFSLFVTYVSDLSYVYGSVGVLMLFMLWLYMIMYILLLGAEFNKYVFIKTLRK